MSFGEGCWFHWQYTVVGRDRTEWTCFLLSSRRDVRLLNTILDFAGLCVSLLYIRPVTMAYFVIKLLTIWLMDWDCDFLMDRWRNNSINTRLIFSIMQGRLDLIFSIVCVCLFHSGMFWQMHSIICHPIFFALLMMDCCFRSWAWCWTWVWSPYP